MSRVICGLKISSTPLPSLPLSSTVATPGAFLPFDTKPIKQGPEPQDGERVDVQALESRPQTAGLYLYADKACGNRLMTHQFLYKRREFITLLAGAADGGRAPTL